MSVYVALSSTLEKKTYRTICQTDGDSPFSAGKKRSRLQRVSGIERTDRGFKSQ